MSWLTGLLGTSSGIASSGSNTDPFGTGQAQQNAVQSQLGLGISQQLQSNWQQAQQAQGLYAQQQQAIQNQLSITPYFPGHSITTGSTTGLNWPDLAKEREITLQLLNNFIIITLMYLGIKRTDKLVELINKDKRISLSVNPQGSGGSNVATITLLGYHPDDYTIRRTLYPLVQNVCFDLFVIKRIHKNEE